MAINKKLQPIADAPAEHGVRLEKYEHHLFNHKGA